MAKKKELETVAKIINQPLDGNACGVNVETKDNNYHVSFPYKRELIVAMKSIEGASFDKAQKAWTVPVTNYDAVKAGVENLRGLNDKLEFDHTVAVEAAKMKIAEVTVKDAFTRDNTRTTGEVIAITDHYVVQQTGKDKAVVHEKAALSAVPSIGQKPSLFYAKGLGLVQERKASAERTREVSPSR